MKCENCNEREAQIHLTQIVANSVTTVHLCEQCAVDKGVQTGAVAAKFPLSDFVASIGKGIAPSLQDEAGAGECPSCHGTLRDFRETGQLGCPVCYDTFENHLKDLLRRLHGASQHVGKYYHGPEGAIEPDKRAEELRQQLKRAVHAENFELAAELRDQLQLLD